MLRHRLAPVHSPYLPGHPQTMLTELYIEALLVDEKQADLVWELWDVGLIPDELASIAWVLLAAPVVRADIG